MGVNSKTYSPIPGRYKIYIPELAFRNIISVKVGGTGVDIITTGLPGTRQVIYQTNGTFGFGIEFPIIYGSDNPNDPADTIHTEKIHIIWDE